MADMLTEHDALVEPPADTLALARQAAADYLGWDTYKQAVSHNWRTDQYVDYYLMAIRRSPVPVVGTDPKPEALRMARSLRGPDQ